MTPRSFAYSAIDSERAYQDHMWRENAGLTEAPVRTVAEELLMLEEYVARARKVWTDAPRSIEVPVTMDVIRKCAAICVRAMENHGVKNREGF